MPLLRDTHITETAEPELPSAIPASCAPNSHRVMHTSKCAGAPLEVVQLPVGCRHALLDLVQLRQQRIRSPPPSQPYLRKWQGQSLETLK